MPKLLRMKDKSDDYVIKKKDLDSVPFRTIISGKSGLGKTSLIGSLLCLPDFYGSIFKGDNIFIFSPMKNDFKMEKIIEYKKIPKENLFTQYNDNKLNDIYDELVEKFEERIADKKKPENSLILLDDISFSGALKSGLYNAINRVFMNGRKQNISIMLSSQKYSQISTGQRSNASSIFFYNSSMKEKELFETDSNYKESKKEFFKMLSSNLKNKRDFIYVNYSAEDMSEIYRNTNFEIIH